MLGGDYIRTKNREGLLEKERKSPEPQNTLTQTCKIFGVRAMMDKWIDLVNPDKTMQHHDPPIIYTSYRQLANPYLIDKQLT